ncbi:hypothetical protein BCV70DRAFT_202416 [Testicularia cyperi]|uniref:Uncharacterized protein n=1 Tax=Testicularia cyperi TaxID=1882483 RepID=A0A317XKH1_9BASI|nr:hypothetical protein BCV70DRAFT_202416 [Testicularia cyperi]
MKLTKAPTSMLVLSLLALLLAVSRGVEAQLTTNNAQSACVEYGGCTTAQGSQKTETQNAPVTPPAGTPALATVLTMDSAYISSLAAAGATSAFVANGGSNAANTANRGAAASQTVSNAAASSIGNLGNLGSSSTTTPSTSSSSDAVSLAPANIASLAVFLLASLLGAVVLL